MCQTLSLTYFTNHQFPPTRCLCFVRDAQFCLFSPRFRLSALFLRLNSKHKPFAFLLRHSPPPVFTSDPASSVPTLSQCPALHEPSCFSFAPPGPSTLSFPLFHISPQRPFLRQPYQIPQRLTWPSAFVPLHSQISSFSFLSFSSFSPNSPFFSPSFSLRVLLLPHCNFTRVACAPDQPNTKKNGKYKTPHYKPPPEITPNPPPPQFPKKNRQNPPPSTSPISGVRAKKSPSTTPCLQLIACLQSRVCLHAIPRHPFPLPPRH